MRPAGTIRDQRHARRFVDFLVTQGVAARLDLTREGWTVWVVEEDELPRVRAELEEFQRDPASERFACSREAERLRAQAREAQQRAAPPPAQRVQLQAQLLGPSPLTWALLVFAVAVALGTDLGDPGSPSVARLQISAGAGLEEVQRGEVWRLITPIFLHFGPVHLLFNGLALLDFGRRVESLSGTGALLAMVLGFGLFGNVLQYMVAGPHFGGLSGVLYGLFAFVWVMSRRAPQSGYAVRESEVVAFGVWTLACLAGLMGPVGNAAHAGGFVAGLAAAGAALLLRRLRARRG